MSWKATCRHKGRAVIIPLPLCSPAIHWPTPPQPITGSLVLFSVLTFPPNPPPTPGPGQVRCYSSFFRLTDCWSFSEFEGQIWKSSFGPVPTERTGILSHPLPFFVAGCLVGELKVCVWFQIYMSRIPLGFTVVTRFRSEISGRDQFKSPLLFQGVNRRKKIIKPADI